MCFVSSASAVITFPRADKDLLVFFASSRTIPSRLSCRFSLSLTNRRDTVYHSVSSPFACETWIRKMEWLLLDSSFILVLATDLFDFPSSTTSMTSSGETTKRSVAISASFFDFLKKFFCFSFSRRISRLFSSLRKLERYFEPENTRCKFCPQR